MSRPLTESECLQALTGRIIKSINFVDPSESEIAIVTQDGLIFQIGGCNDETIYIEQVTE
tara:strand:- start:209 stop:388 length:180 start_codon:yes stop_codon:yes gene_type:complete